MLLLSVRRSPIHGSNLHINDGDLLMVTPLDSPFLLPFSDQKLGRREPHQALFVRGQACDSRILLPVGESPGRSVQNVC